jgi:Protein of unknown function (DUF3043)
VRLLRRRTTSQAEEDATVDPAAEAAGAVDPRRPVGKGRPTPKRREAQKRRTGPVAPPPRTRREAYRRAREQNAVKRVEAREGIRSGDERYLPVRDRGPVRRLVRDIVDSRRNAGGVFLLVALVVLPGSLVPDVRVRAFAATLWMPVFALVLIDSVILGVRIRRLVRQRYPDSTERVGMLVWYGVTRATMIRRWRMPKPAVNVGDPV